MFSNDTKIKVGILRGGTGEHYASSLREGGNIISHIFENLSDKYRTVDIFIDKNSNWHMNGLPITPADLAHKIDVIWNTSEHPDLSVILDNFSIPSIGKGHFLKVLENNNDMLRKHMKEIGVQMPRSIVLPKNAREIFERFAAPWIVKIDNETKVVKTFNELAETIKNKNSVIVEEFITGKSSSVHSITGFRGEDIYVLSPQNLPTGRADFTADEKNKIINFAKNLHKHLAAEHYLKSDFILHPRRGFFLTSIGFLPDLKKGSHFDQSCKSVGAEMHHVIEHILKKTLNRKI